MQTRIQAQPPILCRQIRRKIYTEQTNPSDMLMSTYLSSDSRSVLEVARNVDLDGRLLDDEDDEEEEWMINADSSETARVSDARKKRRPKF